MSIPCVILHQGMLFAEYNPLKLDQSDWMVSEAPQNRMNLIGQFHVHLSVFNGIIFHLQMAPPNTDVQENPKSVENFPSIGHVCMYANIYLGFRTGD